ncbi:hypothetical protein K456DRAFT_43262 [Colletotrichum gloeosporioides 23]|nr:hypothetical protein K456DRAFT_43262 [Colletotrichum gloeosporioides 23]
MAADAKRICEMAAKRLRHNVWSWDVLLQWYSSEERGLHEAGGEGRRRRKPRGIAQSQDILVMLTETSQEVACCEVATCDGIDDECDSQAPSRAKRQYACVAQSRSQSVSSVSASASASAPVHRASWESGAVVVGSVHVSQSASQVSRSKQAPVGRIDDQRLQALGLFDLARPLTSALGCRSAQKGNRYARRLAVSGLASIRYVLAPAEGQALLSVTRKGPPCQIFPGAKGEEQRQQQQQEQRRQQEGPHLRSGHLLPQGRWEGARQPPRRRRFATACFCSMRLFSSPRLACFCFLPTEDILNACCWSEVLQTSRRVRYLHFSAVKDDWARPRVDSHRDLIVKSISSTPTSPSIPFFSPHVTDSVPGMHHDALKERWCVWRPGNQQPWHPANGHLLVVVDFDFGALGRIELDWDLARTPSRSQPENNS